MIEVQFNEDAFSEACGKWQDHGASVRANLRAVIIGYLEAIARDSPERLSRRQIEEIAWKTAFPEAEAPLMEALRRATVYLSKRAELEGRQ